MIDKNAKMNHQDGKFINQNAKMNHQNGKMNAIFAISYKLCGQSLFIAWKFYSI